MGGSIEQEQQGNKYNCQEGIKISDEKGAEMLIQFSKDKDEENTAKRTMNGGNNCQKCANQRQQCSKKDENKENVPIVAKSSTERKRICHILRCKPREDKALSSFYKKQANEKASFKAPTFNIDSMPVARGDILVSRCTFQCPYCPAKSDMFRWFQVHMKQEHNVFVAVSAAQYYLTKGLVYRCRICSAQILCERAILSKQLAIRYRMGLFGYRWQH